MEIDVNKCTECTSVRNQHEYAAGKGAALPDSGLRNKCVADTSKQLDPMLVVGIQVVDGVNNVVGDPQFLQSHEDELARQTGKCSAVVEEDRGALLEHLVMREGNGLAGDLDNVL
eukprot:TRINITY_DN28613_c0_g1_i10.p3 TRINITY_DN28613_c0_g1~~TRINITY_DN28613_c0_g1_i10.p3  ORF type:complete len:115 (-),score=8.42 TRINITY_DN28613_c0_g1_i10:308-652(-)